MTGISRRDALAATIALAAAQEPAMAHVPTAQPRDDRYARGLAALRAVGGEDYDATARSLDSLTPDFSAILVAGAYGDVIARPALSLKARELISVAAITTLGTARPALKFHVNGMLNTGWSPKEVVETAIHAVVYAGFPFAQDALLVIRDLFRERGIMADTSSGRPRGDDWKLGVEQLLATGGDDAAAIARQALEGDDAAAELARLTVTFAHGEVWNRPSLSQKDRALATLAMAITAGNQDDRVRFHVENSLRAGWTRVEIIELLIQMTVYVGWPQALTAVAPAMAAFAAAEKPASLPKAGSAAAAIAGPRLASESDDARYQRGVATMGRISRSSGEAVVDSFRDVAPDLGRYILEFAYGEVFARGDLDLKSRELATVAALTARGTAADETPLKVHVAGALNTGASEGEIAEAILHMLPYAGFPRVQAAMGLAAEVFGERKADATKYRQ
ncbi:MAG: carboxymuconolactone decarboxylase family protein [Pseudomonadota bacterium]|nr:carboxymuconolactone decarboxylase family protein [Pseudomonadota bacterium]